MAIDECGIFACEPHRGTGDIDGLTRTPDWLDGLKYGLHSFAPCIRLIVRKTERRPEYRGSDGSGADAVHADALFAQFRGCAAGQLDDGCFARRVHMRSIPCEESGNAGCA